MVMYTPTPLKVSGDYSNERGTVNITIIQKSSFYCTSPKPVTNTITVKPRTYLRRLLNVVLPKPFQWARWSLVYLSRDWQAEANLTPFATVCRTDSIPQ